MKRAAFLFAGLAALVLPACQKEKAETPEGAPVQTSYTVSLEGWTFQKGDRLNLMSGQYTAFLTAESSGESVVFSGKVPRVSGTDGYIAVYPASDDGYALEGRRFSASIPSAVIPENGQMVGAIAAGVPSGGSLTLSHATAFVSFTTTREDISSIIIRSAGKSVAGELKVSVSGSGVPTATLANGAEAIIINDILTPGTYTVAVPAQGYNGFTVEVFAAEGSGKKEIAQAKRLNPGMVMDLGTVDDMELELPRTVPTLELLGVAASSAAVTWSISGFNDVYTDIAQNWSAGIYNDAACTDLRVSWDFPSAMWTLCEGNNISTLEGPYSPRFIFTSLEPETEYYVKVWYTANPSSASQVLKVNTPAAVYKTQPEGFAKEGDVILQEDFSELPWGGDVSTRSFGYSDKNRGSAPAFHAANGQNPVGEQTIDGFKHSWYFVYPGTEIGLFNTLRSAVSTTRLSGWTSISEDKTDGKVLARPGYIKLGSSSKTGGVVTPALTSLEHRALVRLSFKAHPFREAVNDPLTASVMVISTEESGVSVLNDYIVAKQEDFTIGEAQQWKDFSFEFLIQPGERLAISSRREGSDSNQRRILIDDVKVELVEYRPQVKVTAIRDAQDLMDFLEAAETYEKEEIVTIENDIDLSDVSVNSAVSFAGILDGQGHSISNWTSSGVTLFQKLAGEVKNLTLDSSCSLQFASTPGAPFGFICAEVLSTGVLDGIVNNADISQTVSLTGSGSAVLSPIAGRSYGLVKNCVNNGNVSITADNATQNIYLGGIVGYFNSGDEIALSNNENHGDIFYRANVKGFYAYIGGITAGSSTVAIEKATSSKGTIEHCLNTGNVTYISTNGGSLEENAGTAGTGNYFKVGGIAGYVEGNVLNCTNGVEGNADKGKVTVTIPTNESGACATGASIGGVAAFVMRNMTECANYGKVSISGTFGGGGTGNAGCGVTGEFAAGGVVGQVGPAADRDEYALSNCHNYGALDLKGWMAYVNGTAFNFGGVAGVSVIPVKDCSNNADMKAESKGAFVRMGGVLGFASGASASTSGLSNNGMLDFRLVRSSAGETGSYKQLASQNRIGGVIGLAGAPVSACVNNGPMNLTTVAADNLAANLEIGGAVGNASNTVEASNNGKLTISYNGKKVYCGGVLGNSPLAQGLGAKCKNTGDMDITCASVDQSWFGGVFGSIPAPSSGNNMHTGLENSGNITLTIENSQSSAFYYLGGVAGTSAQAQVYTDCKNYGDLTYTGHAKIRIGGINAYMNRTANGSVVECDITANCTGRDYSEVGGVSAYTASTDLQDWSFTGNINTSGSTKKVYTGGLLGKSNGKSAFDGCTFSGTLTGADGNNVPGLYVGGLQGNNLAMTFGAESKCVVAAGSKVNGAEVTSLTKENLVSQSSDNGSYTSTATLTNIVIE